jgi:hypothetical protein
VDVFVPDKGRLRSLILEMKRYTLAANNPLPAVNTLNTQKILVVYKSQPEFNITHYLTDKQYGFMWLKTKGNDEELADILKDEEAIKSILYLQGEASFLLEVMIHNHADMVSLIQEIKNLEGVRDLEVQEVLSVIKYRGLLYEDPTAKPRFILPEIEAQEIITI